MKRILIVEDLAFNRDLLIQLLEDNYVVLTAAYGAEGIAVAEHELPALIIMDLSLPIVDGWEATRRIKAYAPTLQHIPIIALSSHAMRGDEEKAQQAGCDDYLSKPLDENLLFKQNSNTSWEQTLGFPKGLEKREARSEEVFTASESNPVLEEVCFVASLSPVNWPVRRTP